MKCTFGNHKTNVYYTYVTYIIRLAPFYLQDEKYMNYREWKVHELQRMKSTWITENEKYMNYREWIVHELQRMNSTWITENE